MRATSAAGPGTDLAHCLPEVREQLVLGLGVSAADYLDTQRQGALQLCAAPGADRLLAVMGMAPESVGTMAEA